MTFVKGIAGALSMAMLIGSGFSAAPARAAYVDSLVQSGTSVVEVGSGTLNLTGLTIDLPGQERPLYMAPAVPAISSGTPLPSILPLSILVDLYGGPITGPAIFGSGGFNRVLGATSGSGADLGLLFLFSKGPGLCQPATSPGVLC